MDMHSGPTTTTSDKLVRGLRSAQPPDGVTSQSALPLDDRLSSIEDPRLTAHTAELQRVSILGQLQRSVGNQAAMRFVERASSLAPSASARVQRSVLDPAKPTIAYPAGLLAVCPSLSSSGHLEGHAGPALQALVGSYNDAEKMKADLATAKATFQASLASHGQNLAAPPSQSEIDKIKSATGVADPTQDPAGAIARDATIHVSELLSNYRNHLNDVKTLFDQINDVDRGAVANAALKLDTEKKKAEEKAKQKELKDVQDQSTLANILGGVLNQIGQGIAGESMKLATAAVTEKLTATRNADNAGKGKPMQGTLLAMGLEDLAGGTGGVGFLVLNAATDLVNRITGVHAKQDDLQKQIGILQDAVQKQSLLAASNDLTLARTQQEIHQRDLQNKHDALDDDATHLRQLMASMNVAVDKRAGVSTFEDAAAAMSAADVELSAGDAYKQACTDLMLKAGDAVASIQTAPTAVSNLLWGGDANSGADPNVVVAEINNLSRAEAKEITDTDTEKTNVSALKAKVEQRVGQAFDAAMGGVAGAQRTWGGTP